MLNCFPGTLIVNGREYRGQVQGQFVGLDLDQPMYVGGVPNYRQVSPGAGYRQGFVGKWSHEIFTRYSIQVSRIIHDNIE